MVVRNFGLSVSVGVCVMPISPVPPPGASPANSQSLESIARQRNGVSHPLATPSTPPKIDIAPAPSGKNQQSRLSPATAGPIGSKANKMA
jgi:hypothetical protein